MRAKFTLWFRILKNLIEKEVWVIEGTEISTSQPLKIIFAGRVQNKFHIIKLAFDSTYKETSLGKKYFWNLYYLISKNRYECSLAIIEGINLDRYLYKAVKDFFTPLWLESIVDIPLDITNRSAKEDVRKMKKNKLGYYVTKDMEKLHDFFHNWYLPMIRTQHKKGTFEYTYNAMIQKVKEGCCQLLVSTKDGVPVSGVLIQSCDKIPQLLINGISDIKYQKYGAIASTYYFSSTYFAKLGYKKLSFLNNRSFLKDGLLQYKKKWHPTVKSSDTRGFIVKPLEASNALTGFFLNNPFTYIDNGKLYGAIFIAHREPCSKKDCEKFKKDYYLKGFSGLNVFSFDEEDKGIRKKNGFSFGLVCSIV